jgi:type IV secretory pathway TrbD component
VIQATLAIIAPFGIVAIDISVAMAAARAAVDPIIISAPLRHLKTSIGLWAT